jgi:hypothetical protein
MGVVRGAAVRRTRLCPNYLLAESGLRLDDRSIFTAHELAQMVPVTPSRTYAALLAQNAWYRDFLPNATPRSALTADPVPSAGRALTRIAEAALRSRPGERIERWEMRRKVRWLSATAASVETRYDAASCKGHDRAHGRRALAAYEDRLAHLAVARP